VCLVQHDLIYTFFHPMLRDEQDFDKTNVLKLRGECRQWLFSKSLTPPHLLTYLLTYFDALTLFLWHYERHNRVCETWSTNRKGLVLMQTQSQSAQPSDQASWRVGYYRLHPPSPFIMSLPHNIVGEDIMFSCCLSVYCLDTAGWARRG